MDKNTHLTFHIKYVKIVSTHVVFVGPIIFVFIPPLFTCQLQPIIPYLTNFWIFHYFVKLFYK